MADTKQKSIEKLYEALKKKKKYMARVCGDQPPEDPLHSFSDCCNDTFLHMAIRLKQNDLVRLLLEKLSKDDERLLSNIKNKEGNTILHELACSDSMKNLAEKVLKNCKDNDQMLLLTARNKFGETPIFCAARHGQTEMFWFLAKEMKLKEVKVKDVMSPPEKMKLEESLELLNSQHHLQRDDKTTVLHISITTGCFGLATQIAGNYSYLINEKDQDSMTALQYMACNSSTFGTRKIGGKEFIGEIIKPQSDQKKGFIDMITAATEELSNSDWSVKEAMKKSEEKMHCMLLAWILVKVDTSWDASSGDDQNPVEKAFELSQKHEGKIPQGSTSTLKYNNSVENPLFLATIYNIPQIVREILNCHPQAIEDTNKEGMNILHVAIIYRQIQIFDMVVEEFEVLSRRLLSATDDKGNSLLHMVGQKKKIQVGEKIQNPALQLREELMLFKKVKKACQVHVTKPLNKEKKTAEELFATRNEKLHKEATEWLMRSTENCTLLSVFIATVAFAAAYTVPGGPDQNTGIPILNCKPFFVVFILADLISLTWALRSVGIFLSILQSSFLLEDFEKHLFKKLIHGIICLTLSVLMMAVAFGATIILIMEHNWKKAVWRVVAFLPVPIFFLSYSPLLSAVLRTDPGKLSKKVLKSIKVVALVALVALIILLGLIIRLCRACMELFNTVAKACRYKSQPKSDTQSSQQTADSGAGV